MNTAVTRGIATNYFIEKTRRLTPFSMPSNHMHDEYEFFFLSEGEGDFFIDNKHSPISAGDLVFIKKNIPHRTDYSSTQPHTRYLIELKEDKLVHILKTFLSIDPEQFLKPDFAIYSLTKKDQDEAVAIFDSIIYELQQKKDKYERFAELKLAELLVGIYRYSYDTSLNSFEGKTLRTDKDDMIASVLEYIHSNLTEDISLDSIASQFFINKSYLGRLFKEATNYTVSDYINIERVRTAKLYLLKTNYSIEKISQIVGFSYSSYFTRIFKKYTEVSPLQYRKKEKKVSNSVRYTQYLE